MRRWLPALAAAVATGGDLLMLHAVASGAAGGPASVAWVVAGGVLGAVTIPLYGLGYGLVLPTLRRWSSRGARAVAAAGTGVGALGALIHVVTAWAIVAEIRAGTAATDWLAATLAWGTPVLTLWAIAAALAVVASVVIVWGGFRLGVWPLVLASPVLGTLVLAAAGAVSVTGRAYLVPAAPNAAHAVFFAVAAYVSVRRLGRRPASLRVAIATSDAQIEECYPVMAQLRPHVRPDEFVGRVRAQEAHGYRLAFVRDAGRVVAVTGFRPAQSLAWGRFLYVDDLVVDETWRSRGIGHRLVAWLLAHAQEEGCGEVHLDSGTQRLDAHRFYEREGFRHMANHFRIRLDGGPD